MTSSEEIYLIVNFGGDKFAINTCSIQSIHSFDSINFNEDLSRCLPMSDMDWDKSIPVVKPKCSSNDESESSQVKHSSRVIFLSDDRSGGVFALIVNMINKIVNVSSEKENLNEIIKNDVIKQIQINNEEVEIFDIRKVFMT
ncbi:MAG: hypothetical protein ACTSQ9_04075 [Candidatus Hodarchaeales archaeon]